MHHATAGTPCRIRRFHTVIIAGIFLAVSSSCADLEGPVRGYGADTWGESSAGEAAAEWELTPPGAIEILVVEQGPGKGVFGHAAIHVGDQAYSWDFGGGYVLVRQKFSDFLWCYTYKHNRNVKGTTIEFSGESIDNLLLMLNEEYLKAWFEGYKRSPVFIVSNCSTLVYHALIEASGAESKPWPPVLLPSWMEKNVQRTFSVLYYTTYQKARP